MRFFMGLTLIALGIVLMLSGYHASESIASDISRFFKGTPTVAAIWLLLGGAASIIVGLGACLTRVGQRKGDLWRHHRREAR